MKRTSVASNRAWSHVGYSRAIRVGDLIEVAGTSSSGPGGQILHLGDMYAEATECKAFANVDPQPASAFVGIKELLHPDLLIEIEATAVVGG